VRQLRRVAARTNKQKNHLWCVNAITSVSNVINRMRTHPAKRLRLIRLASLHINAHRPINIQRITEIFRFYRAMHFSAKRGIAIACRLSVRPSVCDVGGL